MFLNFIIKRKLNSYCILFMTKNMNQGLNFSSLHNPYDNRDFRLPSPQKNVGSYRIDYSRLVGQGNFSTVYMCLSIREPNVRLVAKIVNYHKLRQQRLENLIQGEIEILKEVCHNNIIQCKEVLRDDTWYYIITEYCQGGNVQDRIKKEGFFSERDSLPIIKDVLEGLIYLETKHIIHRDIKAANIFFKEGRAIIADFGFARFVKQLFRYPRHPFNDLNIGSLPYMPPEAVKDSYYCSKTDVWAFGVFIYQLLHGESPYAKSFNVPDLLQKMYQPLPASMFRADISQALKELILFCLQVDIGNRPHFQDIQKTWFYEKLFVKRNEIKKDRKASMKHFSQNFGTNREHKRQEQKQSFKSILLQLQQIRDFYKLSITLQSRSPKIDKIKDRLLIRASRQIDTVHKKVESGAINYGGQNTAVRRQKLSNIIEQYKEQFQKHVKRRGIVIQKTPNFLLIRTKVERTLEEDIGLIQEEIKYSSSDHDKYMESQEYRSQIKEILDDIRSIGRQKNIGRER